MTCHNGSAAHAIEQRSKTRVII